MKTGIGFARSEVERLLCEQAAALHHAATGEAVDAGDLYVRWIVREPGGPVRTEPDTGEIWRGPPQVHASVWHRAGHALRTTDT